jgi:hypothetical protein
VPEDPVAVAAPAVEVDPPPRDTPDPPKLVPPPVVPVVVEAAPVLPPALPPALPVVPVGEVVKDDVVPPVAVVEVEVDVVVPTAEVEVVPAAGVEVVVVVVPAAGVVVVDEFCTVGKATAPPPAGNPLRSVALPTPPVVGVAVCARAVETRPMDSRKANPALRIMAGYIMRQRPPWRERPDQTA